MEVFAVRRYASAPMGSGSARYLVVVVAAVIFIGGIVGRHFATRGEGREALVAQRMFSSSNWILPEAYGGDVPSKPPLLHWMISLFSRLSGEVNELTARLPSALAAIFFITIFYLFLDSRYSSGAALLSVAILGTSFEFFRAGTSCRVDMVLTIFLAGGMIALYRWHERGLGGAPWLAIFLLCGATMAKGPIGILLPSAIFGLFLLLEGKAFYRALRSVLIFCIPVMLLSSLWYFLAYQQGGERFLEKAWYENISRFASTMEDKPHSHNVLYLVGMLPLGLLPWSIPVIAVLIASRSVLRGDKSKIFLSYSHLDQFVRYSLLICGCFFIFFSVPSSKRGVYLLPIYPFLAFLMARLLQWGAENVLLPLRLTLRTIGGIIFAFAIFAVIAMGFAEQIALRLESISAGKSIFEITEYLKFTSKDSSWLDVILIGTVLVSSYGVLSVSSNRDILLRFSTMSAALFITVSFVFMNKVNNNLSSKRFSRQLSEQVPSSEQLFSFEYEFYGVSFYMHREIIRLEDAQETPHYIVLYERDLATLRESLESKEITIRLTSDSGVEKPGAHVLLVQVENTV